MVILLRWKVLRDNLLPRSSFLTNPRLPAARIASPTTSAFFIRFLAHRRKHPRPERRISSMRSTLDIHTGPLDPRPSSAWLRGLMPLINPVKLHRRDPHVFINRRARAIRICVILQPSQLVLNQLIIISSRQFILDRVIALVLQFFQQLFIILIQLINCVEPWDLVIGV